MNLIMTSVKEDKNIIDKVRDISYKRGFTNFWEVFQYMIDAGYDEVQALKIGLEIFNGKLWDNIISANCTSNSNFNILKSNDGRYVNVGFDSAVDDDLSITINIMTKYGNINHLPIYRAYIETQKYHQITEFDDKFKQIKLKLKTELAINLFKNDCSKFKNI